MRRRVHAITYRLVNWCRTDAILLVGEVDAIVEVVAAHRRLDAPGQIASELAGPASVRTQARAESRF